MKITNDKPVGRSAQASRYHSTFVQLSPEKNCIVFDDQKQMESTSQALETWVKKHVPGGKVTTTKRYPADGKPRCWLIYPHQPKTAVRGNFPKVV